MSLIDKDKGVDAIAMYLFINDAIKSPVPMKVADYKTFAESVLKDVPEVDAIPRDYYEKVVEALCRKYTEEIASMPDIVRCKDCKSWKWIEWAKEYRCTLRNTAFNARADDFCSYGEREGE